MDFHQLASEYPLMPAHELGRMEQGMREHGFDRRFPIITYEGKILDGRNRFLAAQAAGVKPVFKDFKGDDDAARWFVQQANEERRHLAADWLKRRREERVERVAAARQGGQSLRTIAEAEGVSVVQVQRDLEDADSKDIPDSSLISGVPGGTPENGSPSEKSQKPVTGKDGKQYPAGKPPPVLCERCKRTGVVKGCPMCADLRRADAPTPDPAANGRPPKEDRPPPVDAFGTEIPKRCRAAWTDPWVQDAIDFLAVVGEKFRLERLADGITKRKKHYPFFDVKDFVDGCGFVISYFDQLLEHLKDHRPAGVCPSCEGKGCGHCRMAGLVSRALYAELKGVKA